MDEADIQELSFQTQRSNHLPLLESKSFATIFLSHSLIEYSPMELIHFVKTEEAQLAKQMEAKLLALPPESGILFVSVMVEPSTPSTSAVYKVWIGSSRDVDPRMLPTLVEVTLRDEVKEGHCIRTESRMGNVRS